MLWCPIPTPPERRQRIKCMMIAQAVAHGWPDGKVVEGMPPDDDNPIACYGQAWGVEHYLRRACERNRPFWHIDNGYFRPGRGSAGGYYRFTYRSMSPQFLQDAPSYRFRGLAISMREWRRNGAHVLIGLPGLEYGTGIGLCMPTWINTIEREVRKHTDRPIIVRPRNCRISLWHHLANCWAVVTHSSNIATDAICAGIPAFVSPLSMAAPVANLDLKDLENPAMPSRDKWAHSLACQQFTVYEMSNGTAYSFLRDIENGAVCP
jgi:hypothetical protein